MFRFLCSVFVLAWLAAGTLGAESNHLAAAKLEQLGLPNLHRVTPILYRSAQPTADGMRSAEKLGIKTVISLRAFHSDKDELESTTLQTERIYFKTWHPEDEDIVRFLKIVSNTNAGPFLVHCQHGSDRTGTMIAVFRLVVQRWTKEEAIKEMTGGDFGFHAMWKNLVSYLQALDVEGIRLKAGLRKIPTR